MYKQKQKYRIRDEYRDSFFTTEPIEGYVDASNNEFVVARTGMRLPSFYFVKVKEPGRVVKFLKSIAASLRESMKAFA